MRATHRFASIVSILAAVFISWQPLAHARVEAGPCRWTKQAPIPTWYSLQGIAPLSPNECWIASAPLLGEIGELAHTVGAPLVIAINGITAVNATTAWIAGWNGFVARTADGGQTWRPESITGAETIDFEDALFLNAQRGWVGGNIGIWQRSQGR